MTVRTLVNDITFHTRIVEIRTDDRLLVYDGNEAIKNIPSDILDREINAYITKLEKGVLHLEIHI